MPNYLPTGNEFWDNSAKEQDEQVLSGGAARSRLLLSAESTKRDIRQGFVKPPYRGFLPEAVKGGKKWWIDAAEGMVKTAEALGGRDDSKILAVMKATPKGELEPSDSGLMSNLAYWGVGQGVNEVALSTAGMLTGTGLGVYAARAAGAASKVSKLRYLRAGRWLGLAATVGPRKYGNRYYDLLDRTGDPFLAALGAAASTGMEIGIEGKFGPEALIGKGLESRVANRVFGRALAAGIPEQAVGHLARETVTPRSFARRFLSSMVGKPGELGIGGAFLASELAEVGEEEMAYIGDYAIDRLITGRGELSGGEARRIAWQTLLTTIPSAGMASWLQLGETHERANFIRDNTRTPSKVDLGRAFMRKGIVDSAAMDDFEAIRVGMVKALDPLGADEAIAAVEQVTNMAINLAARDEERTPVEYLKEWNITAQTSADGSELKAALAAKFPKGSGKTPAEIVAYNSFIIDFLRGKNKKFDQSIVNLGNMSSQTRAKKRADAYATKVKEAAFRMWGEDYWTENPGALSKRFARGMKDVDPTVTTTLSPAEARRTLGARLWQLAYIVGEGSHIALADGNYYNFRMHDDGSLQILPEEVPVVQAKAAAPGSVEVSEGALVAEQSRVLRLEEQLRRADQARIDAVIREIDKSLPDTEVPPPLTPPEGGEALFEVLVPGLDMAKIAEYNEAAVDDESIAEQTRREISRLAPQDKPPTTPAEAEAIARNALTAEMKAMLEKRIAELKLEERNVPEAGVPAAVQPAGELAVAPVEMESKQTQARIKRAESRAKEEKELQELLDAVDEEADTEALVGKFERHFKKQEFSAKMRQGKEAVRKAKAAKAARQKAAVVAKRAEKILKDLHNGRIQRSLTSEKKTTIYGWYLPSNHLAVFLQGANAEDVMHEYFHHLCNGLLPPNVMWRLSEQFASTDPDTGHKIWDVPAEEKAVDAFTKYLRDVVVPRRAAGEGPMAEVWEYIRSVLKASYHADRGMLSQETSQVFEEYFGDLVPSPEMDALGRSVSMVNAGANGVADIAQLARQAAADNKEYDEDAVTDLRLEIVQDIDAELRRRYNKVSDQEGRRMSEAASLIRQLLAIDDEADAPGAINEAYNAASQAFSPVIAEKIKAYGRMFGQEARPVLFSAVDAPYSWKIEKRRGKFYIVKDGATVVRKAGFATDAEARSEALNRFGGRPAPRVGSSQTVETPDQAPSIVPGSTVQTKDGQFWKTLEQPHELVKGEWTVRAVSQMGQETSIRVADIQGEEAGRASEQPARPSFGQRVESYLGYPMDAIGIVTPQGDVIQVKRSEYSGEDSNFPNLDHDSALRRVALSTYGDALRFRKYGPVFIWDFLGMNDKEKVIELEERLEAPIGVRVQHKELPDIWGALADDISRDREAPGRFSAASDADTAKRLRNQIYKAKITPEQLDKMAERLGHVGPEARRNLTIAQLQRIKKANPPKRKLNLDKLIAETYPGKTLDDLSWAMLVKLVALREPKHRRVQSEEVKAAAGELLDDLRNIPDSLESRAVAVGGHGVAFKLMNAAKRTVANAKIWRSRSMRGIAQEMTGAFPFFLNLAHGRLDSPFITKVYQSMRDAQTEYNHKRIASNKWFVDALNRIGDIPDNMHIAVPLDGVSYSLDEAIALHMVCRGNPTTLDALALKQSNLEFWRDAGGATSDEHFAKAVAEAAAYISENKQAGNLVRLMDEYYEWMYPQINEVYKAVRQEVFGETNPKNLGKIIGYFPMIHEGGMFWDEDRLAKMLNLTPQSVRIRLNPRARLMARDLGSLGRPIRTDVLGILETYRMQADTYVAKEMTLMRLGEMFGLNKPLSYAFHAKGRFDDLETIRDLIEHERHATGRIEPMGNLELFLRKMRVNTQWATLVMNMPSVLNQPISVLNGISEIPGFFAWAKVAKYNMQGTAQMRRAFLRVKPGEVPGFDKIFENFRPWKLMQKYGSDSLSASHDIFDTLNTANMKGFMSRNIKLGRFKMPIGEAGLLMQRFADIVTRASVWGAAFDAEYAKLNREGSMTEDVMEKKAAAFAESVTNMSQPGASTFERNLWQKGGEIGRMMTMFTGQLFKSKDWMSSEIAWPIKRVFDENKGNPQKILEGLFNITFIKPAPGTNTVLAKKVFFGVIAPAMALGFVARGRPPKDWKEFVTDVFAYNVAIFPIIGPAVSFAILGGEARQAGMPVYSKLLGTIASISQTVKGAALEGRPLLTKNTIYDVENLATLAGIPKELFRRYREWDNGYWKYNDINPVVMAHSLFRTDAWEEWMRAAKEAKTRRANKLNPPPPAPAKERIPELTYPR